MSVTIKNGKLVAHRTCVNFLMKLEMAAEADRKGYVVEFTADGIDVYEKIVEVRS